MATTPTKTSKPFRVGDLVKVLEGTHDPSLPKSRTGLVVEVLTGRAPLTSKSGTVYMVRFGTSVLKFHPMWLVKV